MRVVPAGRGLWEGLRPHAQPTVATFAQLSQLRALCPLQESLRAWPSALQAKYDFVEEMLKWSGARQPQKILDVGCGIGGTSRYLADKFRDASVTGALAQRGAACRACAAAAAIGAALGGQGALLSRPGRAVW